jgi:hypothetical protein
MATAKKSKIPPAKLDLYEKLIATHPEIERKGAVHPYTSLNGHMVHLSGSDRHDGHPAAGR